MQLCSTTMKCFIVDGQWSDWVTECSKTCGGGTWSITRQCNNPEPSCGGKQCEGMGNFTYPGCNQQICCPGKNMHIVAQMQPIVTLAMGSGLHPGHKDYIIEG